MAYQFTFLPNIPVFLFLHIFASICCFLLGYHWDGHKQGLQLERMWLVARGAGSEVGPGGKFWPDAGWDQGYGRGRWGSPWVSEVKIGKSDQGWYVSRREKRQEEGVSQFDFKGHSLGFRS